MAAISDPRAVKFCDEKARPMADQFVTTYRTAVAFMQQWNAQQMGGLIPFSQDVIADKAAPDGVDAAGGDGRPVVTGANIEQVFNFASMIVSAFERGTLDNTGNANNAWLNNMLAVAVNGQPKF
jgi:hypothetical protein